MAAVENGFWEAEKGRPLRRLVQYPRRDGNDSDRGGETWSDSGSFLKTDPTGLPVGLGVSEEEESTPLPGYLI